ncbi:MAG TPA: hypothetical protein VFB38_05400 [Chthonomonadaceae bacterium]|nr:hypothetical protein [Chthonomonadaceae bacterium]
MQSTGKVSSRCPNCGRQLRRWAWRCYACPWKRRLSPLLLTLLAVLVWLLVALIHHR